MASMRARFVNWLVGSEVARRVNLAVRALDDVHDRRYGKTETDRDRRAYKREELLEQALEAWRENPLARRIVELTSDYVVGGGLQVASEHAGTHAFLQQWWCTRLNHMSVRVFEWCDELTRSGELFPVLSTDAVGMSTLRALPAAEIAEITTAVNDLEQELRYEQTAVEVGGDPIWWPAYDALTDGRDAAGVFAPVMLHYVVNRPVGALRGESDLAPFLRWLTRYSAWLEDRVRLNRFRQTFLFWVKRMFRSEADRVARQAELNANPPNPGSILVTHAEESWDVLHPKLDSFEAGADGLALKKMIAAGAAIPLHFLAEPEGATRTTAESSGGPTFRHYDRRQLFFTWMMTDIARIVVARRAQVDPTVRADAPIRVSGQDISVRDNTALAQAAEAIGRGFGVLYGDGLITAAEYARMMYKFAGEVVDVDMLLAKSKAAVVAKEARGE